MGESGLSIGVACSGFSKSESVEESSTGFDGGDISLPSLSAPD